MVKSKQSATQQIQVILSPIFDPWRGSRGSNVIPDLWVHMIIMAECSALQSQMSTHLKKDIPRQHLGRLRTDQDQEK